MTRSIDDPIKGSSKSTQLSPAKSLSTSDLTTVFQALNDPVASVRDASLRALSKLPLSNPALNTVTNFIANQLSSLLISSQPQKRSRHRSSAARELLLTAASFPMENLRDTIQAFFEEGTQAEQRFATYAMATLKDEAARSQLLKDLEGSDSEVRAKAAEHLLFLDAEPIKSNLDDLIETESNGYVRLLLALGLLRAGETTPLSSIFKEFHRGTIESPSFTQRRFWETLARIGQLPEQSIQVLKEQIKPGQPSAKSLEVQIAEYVLEASERLPSNTPRLMETPEGYYDFYTDDKAELLTRTCRQHINTGILSIKEKVRLETGSESLPKDFVPRLFIDIANISGDKERGLAGNEVVSWLSLYKKPFGLETSKILEPYIALSESSPNVSSQLAWTVSREKLGKSIKSLGPSLSKGEKRIRIGASRLIEEIGDHAQALYPPITIQGAGDFLSPPPEVVDQPNSAGASKDTGSWVMVFPSQGDQEPPLPPSEPPESPPPPGPGDPLPQPEAQKNREITVTGHALNGTAIFQFKEGKKYKLRFRVGPLTVENLASGDAAIKDVPKEGLKTHWVVTSTDVEFVTAPGTCAVQKIGSTSLAKFDLLIPERGDSATKEVAVLGGAKPGNLLVTIYAVSTQGKREIYREVSVSLAGHPEVKVDETCKAPQHTHLRTTHEWTTPAEHIQVSIKNGIADISTKRARLEVYEFFEQFAATDNLISGAIKNVRDSLEKFRQIHETYLNDLDPSDISARLASRSWETYYASTNGWQPLPDIADAAHRAVFDNVQKSAEWRDLASDGYALFSRCFAVGTKLRDLLNKLLPGSRIDFHWTEQSGPGWVSHVPWALMYMEPVDATGQTPADPEKFLGLRFRIGTRSWSVNNGSVALGDLRKTSRMHLLYWGDKTGDDVAVEAQWQTGEYKNWKQSRLLPDSALPDLKRQIVLALDAPGPSPVSILYFYCHCSVGDGGQPCLRFGNTSRPEDTVSRTELSQRNIPDGPIIFANACTTSQADPHMTSDLEQGFFQRGVRAFIGTETKVPIKLASKFAWLYFQFFYRRVDASPMAAGEALTQARMFLWTEYKNVGGLFYSMANQYDLYLASDNEVLSLLH